MLLLTPAACGKNDSASAPTSNAAQGRKETEAIRATDAIGYDGQTIGDKVDQALNANDAREDELDKAVDSQ